MYSFTLEYLDEEHVPLHGGGVHELPHLVDVDEGELLPLVVRAQPTRDLPHLRVQVGMISELMESLINHTACKIAED